MRYLSLTARLARAEADEDRLRQLREWLQWWRLELSFGRHPGGDAEGDLRALLRDIEAVLR